MSLCGWLVTVHDGTMWIGRRLASLVLVLTISGGALAQQGLDAMPAVPLYLEVVLNGTNTGLVVEVTRGAEGRLTMRTDELLAIGVDTAGLPGRQIALDAIPGVAARYVEANQQLEISAAAGRLAPARLGPGGDERLDADWSAGAALNYDFNLRFDSGTGRALDLSGAVMGIDAWAFAGPARLSTTGLLQFDVGTAGRTGFERYDTALDLDIPGAAIAARLGETISSVPAWGRPVRLGGIQVRRDFALRRDLITRPLLSYEGTAAVPSTVDILIDDTAVFSTPAEPGRFRIDDIPVISGPGTAIVSIRNADGTVTREELPFFGGRALLRSGVADWSVEAGRPRLGFGAGRSTYLPDEVYSGTGRYGVTDRLTLEAHGENTREFSLTALGATTILLNRFEVGLSGGGSHYDGTRGHFAFATVSAYPWRGLRFEGSMFRSSAGFIDLPGVIDDRETGRPTRPGRRRDILSAGLPVGKHDFGVSYIRAEDDRLETQLYAFGYSGPLFGGRGSLNVSASHDTLRGDTNVAILASVPLGRRTVQAALTEDGGLGLLLNQPAEDRIGGWGYTLEAVPTGPSRRAGGRVFRRTGLGEVDLSARVGARYSAVDARLRGAFATIDGRIAAGPPIRESFAIVDGGRRGLPVRVQNREVAVTGPRGYALVSDLQPLSRNRVSIDVVDLPLDAVWQTSAAEVVPGRRAGALVSFGVADRESQILLTLTDAGGTPLPLGTPILIAGRRNDLGVGYDGAVFLKDVRPGTALVAELSRGPCRAEVPVPAPAGQSAVAVCR